MVNGPTQKRRLAVTKPFPKSLSEEPNRFSANWPSLCNAFSISSPSPMSAPNRRLNNTTMKNPNRDASGAAFRASGDVMAFSMPRMAVTQPNTEVTVDCVCAESRPPRARPMAVPATTVPTLIHVPSI